MKTALVVLALLAVSRRVAFTALGQPVPVSWLIAAAEVLVAAGGVWQSVRVIGPFRSWRSLQAARNGGGGAW
jgi:hypothetical protein